MFRTVDRWTACRASLERFHPRDAGIPNPRRRDAIKLGPRNLHAHRAALDVPAGPAFAPGAGPDTLHPPARAPSRARNRDRFLCVIVALTRSPTRISSKFQFHQIGQKCNRSRDILDGKINRTVGGLCKRYRPDEFFDERDDVAHNSLRAASGAACGTSRS